MKPPSNIDVLTRPETLEDHWRALELVISCADGEGDFTIPADPADREQLLHALIAVGWLEEPVVALVGEEWPWEALERVLGLLDGRWDRARLRPRDAGFTELVADYVAVGWDDLDPPQDQAF